MIDCQTISFGGWARRARTGQTYPLCIHCFAAKGPEGPVNLVGWHWLPYLTGFGLTVTPKEVEDVKPYLDAVRSVATFILGLYVSLIIGRWCGCLSSAGVTSREEGLLSSSRNN